jgi:phospholipid transport system substrate-binding protein
MRTTAIQRLMAALVLLVPLFAAPATAQSSEPQHTVDTLDRALIDVMKSADALGFHGRYERLEPVLDAAFDLPLMARIAVGPDWQSLNPDEQRRVIEAFRRFSVTTYAARFDGFSGEQFEIETVAPVSGGDQVVSTKLVRPSDTPVQLNYRLRTDGGGWRIIDVYLNGTISQLANYRSEFGATLRSLGADGLIQLIEQKTE